MADFSVREAVPRGVEDAITAEGAELASDSLETITTAKTMAACPFSLIAVGRLELSCQKFLLTARSADIFLAIFAENM